MANTTLQPGFRFHPTDVELIMYYLKRKVLGKKLCVEVIRELNINKFTPWDLPDKSLIKSNDREWYFFCPRERKYAKGGRMNRTAEGGYWKTTGQDRSISYEDRTVGMLKTLIFHKGHPPRGERTDWVMHEYRMKDQKLVDAGVAQDAFFLCKLFHKDGPGPRNGAQYGATFIEEEWDDQTPDQAETMPLGLVFSVGTAGATQLLPSTSELTNMGGSEVITTSLLAEPEAPDCGETLPSGILTSGDTAGATQLLPSTSELTSMSGSEVLSLSPLAEQNPPFVPEAGMGISLLEDVDFESLWAAVTDDGIPTDLPHGHENLDHSNLGNPASVVAFSENDAFSNLPDLYNWPALGGGSLSNLSEMQPYPDSYLELNDLNNPLHLAQYTNIIEHMFSENSDYNSVPSQSCYDDTNYGACQYASSSTQTRLQAAGPDYTSKPSGGGGLDQNCYVSTEIHLPAAGPNLTGNLSGGGGLNQNCSDITLPAAGPNLSRNLSRGGGLNQNCYVSTRIPLVGAGPNLARNLYGGGGLNPNSFVSTYIPLPASGPNFSIGGESEHRSCGQHKRWLQEDYMLPP